MNDETDHVQKPKSSARQRADVIKQFRCKNLIAVIENPAKLGNIGSVIRNANALGVEKIYIIDSKGALPDDWETMRADRGLSKTSASAVKWTFVKTFERTEDCIAHLESLGFDSVVTSPHVKGKVNWYLHEADFTAPPKLAVWFGNETHGISDLAVAQAQFCVSVPMFGMIESLNLGTSSGIVLYEVTKQRRAYQSTYLRRKKLGKRSEPLPTVMPRND